MTQIIEVLVPIFITILVGFALYAKQSGKVTVTYVNLPPRNSRKGIVTRAVLYTYILVTVLAVVLLSQNGRGSTVLDGLLYIAIAPLPILAIGYTLYFGFTGRDYRLKLGPVGLNNSPVSIQRKLLSFTIFGLLLVYRLVAIRQDTRTPGNYLATAIGILFTMYLVWLFIKDLHKKH